MSNRLAEKAAGFLLQVEAVTSGSEESVLESLSVRDEPVTGFDNLDLGRKLHPTLTTIEQNSVQLMERAGALLLEQIKLPADERGKPIAEFIAPQLVIGESTGPARIGK